MIKSNYHNTLHCTILILRHLIAWLLKQHFSLSNLIACLKRLISAFISSLAAFHHVFLRKHLGCEVDQIIKAHDVSFGYMNCFINVVKQGFIVHLLIWLSRERDFSMIRYLVVVMSVGRKWHESQQRRSLEKFPLGVVSGFRCGSWKTAEHNGSVFPWNFCYLWSHQRRWNNVCVKHQAHPQSLYLRTLSVMKFNKLAHLSNMIFLIPKLNCQSQT